MTHSYKIKNNTFHIPFSSHAAFPIANAVYFKNSKLNPNNISYVSL